MPRFKFSFSACENKIFNLSNVSSLIFLISKIGGFNGDFLITVISSYLKQVLALIY